MDIRGSAAKVADYHMRKVGIAFLVSAALIAAAAQAAAPAANSAKPVRASSLSGALLSAQVAERDNDFDGAIDFYQQALGFDPGNAGL